ncbi:TonB-dependent receptor [Sphingomonas sp. HF-S4]|uniref:TonB-dependent receptor n=1 Tax=Sphingomonas agrestis TaxID=3080540 RepID=A0ABU3YCX3_9SPHN|nr:TonB-dependent receptor [Sphingomonas sp. HF-S4]MDV3459246.1 TonB-dependent receptor [Sphingomonas sp. HF-S4]
MRSTPAASPAFLALACVGFIASAPASAADDKDKPALADALQQEAGGQASTAQEREAIIVTGQAYQPHQQSPKATRTVRDTPQTVTVITAETIEQQNLLTLRDMLSTVPGITFGAAEGGSPPADAITLRGYSAGSDITQDGVRDSAAYSRSDSFNLEQLEIVNGANSVSSGSGSVGGSINLVTKRPLAETRGLVTAGIGTDNYYRGTVDLNLRASELIGLRLNAMVHRNDVPGRDVEDYRRWGVAPAVTIGVGSPTKLTLQYLHQEDDNIPQYGVPYFINAVNDGEVPGVDRSSYYGYRNVDTQEITVDQATITFEHELNSNFSLRNLARWQNVTQLTIVGPPQGTYCLATNVQPTGAACPATTPPGYYLIGGPRGTYRDSKNQLMYDQFDLRGVFNTGGIEHTLVAGASATWEKYNLTNGSVYRNANTTTLPYPLINIANPNEVIAGPAGFNYGSNVWTGPVNPTPTGRQQGEVTNYALYLFDAMKIGKFELNGGVRWESNSGNYRTDALASAATLTTPQGPIIIGPTLRNKAKLFSYRVGLVYKPVEELTLYVAHGNSRTPSISAVNGACTALTCNVKPESAKNYEAGVKAEVANGKLLLSAALFRNERDSYRVPSNDVTIPDQVLDGASRVDGVAVSAVGKITPRWSVTANYTYLKPKLLQSVSDFCLANPSAACANSASVRDPAAGAELQNTPKHSGSLFTSYELPFGLTLGYAATYQGSFALNLPALAAPGGSTLTPVYRSHDYLVHSAVATFQVNEQIKAQLNVKNFTDKVYYTRVRNNGWATPGDGRAAILSLTYGF